MIKIKSIQIISTIILTIIWFIGANVIATNGFFDCLENHTYIQINNGGSNYICPTNTIETVIFLPFELSSLLIGKKVDSSILSVVISIISTLLLSTIIISGLSYLTKKLSFGKIKK